MLCKAAAHFPRQKKQLTMELHLATTIDRRSSVSSAVWPAAEKEAAALQPASDSAASQPIPTKRAAASTPAHSQPLSKKSRQTKSAAAAAAAAEGEDQAAVDQSSVTESDHVVRGILDLARQRQFFASSQQLQLTAAAVLRAGVDAEIQQLEQYDQREMAKELMKLWELGYNKVSAAVLARAGRGRTG
jgi:hypothetical protein